jgi:hypothetical protein
VDKIVDDTSSALVAAQVAIPGELPLAAATCPNCGEVTNGRTRFCTGCGQRQGESLLTVRALVADILEDVFGLDGRLPRTLRGLFFRPGHLTREYAVGHIERYVRPFKLYLASSVIFFLALSLSIKLDIPDDAALEVGQVNSAAPPPRTMADSVAADSGAVAAVTEPRARQRRTFVERVILPFQEKASADPKESGQRLIDRMLDDAPKAVFDLLPIFALFLKILYIRRRRLYVEHLIFVLHVHAFGFLLAAPLLLAPDSWPTGFLWLALPVYLFWAMKRVYGQSWARTAVKFITFGWAYFISVVITLVTVTIIAAVAVGGTVSF